MNRIRINPRGLEEVATSAEMHAAVDAAAETTGANVESQGIRVVGEPGEIPLPVVVRKGETSSRGRGVRRAMAVVQLNHASGAAAQAKHGALSKAASDAGLRLKS